MSYLRLIKHKMQSLSEAVALALNVGVAVADKNLIRIVGTGGFYTKIDDACADDSLFAKVLKDGQARVNLKRDKECKDCSNKENCLEFANMIYPIKDGKETIGVLCFASFDKVQTELIRRKKEEYFNMLKETVSIIEQDIENMHITNKLKKDTAEVNEIINCLNKGIIILNSDEKIIHINSKALQVLDLNISDEKIIEKHINKFIKNIELVDNGNEELVNIWLIKGRKTRVIYTINKIVLDDGESYIMISFEFLSNILNMVKAYEKREKIYFKDIIGDSDIMLEAISKAKTVAKTDSTVLIQGDSGTGKELFAKSIHNESSRRDGPFVAINCSSIPESLMESELFGYEKGAFTGASTSGKKGKIELANNGTLFLDEIGDLPVYLQAKLLRVLQDKTIDRLGSEKSINVNIRIISATNKNLKMMVEEGDFRLDLYYRLNVIPINLPSLRDRSGDVFLISDHVINKLSREMNREKVLLTKEVEDLFLNYSFPGNIRELENVLEHGLCFSRDGFIKPEDLPEYIYEDKKNFKRSSNLEDKTLENLKMDFEKNIIEELISQYGDTVEGKKLVAQRLGIGLTTLYRKINE